VIAIMERGRLAQSGAPLDIVERPASEFVREFVGREGSGLKSLALRTVAERVRPGDGAAGEPIAAGASLRDALAAMTARRTDTLPVINDAGQPAGVITLADLVR
jgi:osmoprotectant transport system ATP-binding protein